MPHIVLSGSFDESGIGPVLEVPGYYEAAADPAFNRRLVILGWKITVLAANTTAVQLQSSIDSFSEDVVTEIVTFSTISAGGGEAVVLTQGREVGPGRKLRLRGDAGNSYAGHLEYAVV